MILFFRPEADPRLDHRLRRRQQPVALVSCSILEERKPEASKHLVEVKDDRTVAGREQVANAEASAAVVVAAAEVEADRGSAVKSRLAHSDFVTDRTSLSVKAEASCCETAAAVVAADAVAASLLMWLMWLREDEAHTRCH